MDYQVNPCLVHLEVFEGPLDLLLHLIKKSELEIYDIPIALITNQYCEYLDEARDLDIDIAGDYLVMASELGLIKSRMLLPKPEIVDDDEYADDPREELVRRLLEYQRYKEVSIELEKRDLVDRDVFIRNMENTELIKDYGMEVAKSDLWLLVGAIHNILERRHQNIRQAMQFELELISLDERIDEVIYVMNQSKKIDFVTLFDPSPTKFNIIITFLAVLELIKRSIISVFQNSPYSNIELVYKG